MPIRFETVDFTIPSGDGVRRFEENAVFSSDVLRAGVALNKVDLVFSGKDKKMGRILTDAGIEAINGGVVTVVFTCQFRDDSDEDYSGAATVLVSAETV